MTLASRPAAAPANKFIKAWDDPFAERVQRLQHGTGTADFPHAGGR
jgi:hypothetical protein